MQSRHLWQGSAAEELLQAVCSFSLVLQTHGRFLLTRRLNKLLTSPRLVKECYVATGRAGLVKGPVQLGQVWV